MKKWNKTLTVCCELSVCSGQFQLCSAVYEEWGCKTPTRRKQPKTQNQMLINSQELHSSLFWWQVLKTSQINDTMKSFMCVEGFSSDNRSHQVKLNTRSVRTPAGEGSQTWRLTWISWLESKTFEISSSDPLASWSAAPWVFFHLVCLFNRLGSVEKHNATFIYKIRLAVVGRVRFSPFGLDLKSTSYRGRIKVGARCVKLYNSLCWDNALLIVGLD